MCACACLLTRTHSISNDTRACTQGDARLMVEHRDGPKGSYGKGRKVPMAFRDLIQRMRKGDDTLYLTTQKVSSCYGMAS